MICLEGKACLLNSRAPEAWGQHVGMKFPFQKNLSRISAPSESFDLLSFSEVEKVSEPGNVVPRNFFGLKFSQKVFKKILRLEENF